MRRQMECLSKSPQAHVKLKEGKESKGDSFLKGRMSLVGKKEVVEVVDEKEEKVRQSFPFLLKQSGGWEVFSSSERIILHTAVS
jgi:hypothetical protein